VLNDEGEMKLRFKIEQAKYAIFQYQQALNITQLSQSQRASIHKNLSRAYEVHEELVGEEDLGWEIQLYYFDQGI